VGDRKARGYWNFETIEKELLAFIDRHGQPGIMPTLTELERSGYVGLLRAINRHGGVVAVARHLGLQHLDKKRPPNYWNDFANLERELREFITEYGQSGQMPSENDLTNEGRWDLVVGIRRHGGAIPVAQQLSLHERRTRKPDGYWNDFTHLEEALRDFLSAQAMGNVMPTFRQLEESGHRDLIEGIKNHGGFFAVAERLGLSRLNTSKPYGYWKALSNIEREVQAFIKEHGQPDLMPSRQVLIAAGRHDLAFAIAQYSGFQTVAKRLGLRMARESHRQDWKNFESFEQELRKFIESTGIVGVMPTTRELRAAGQGALLKGIAKYGGSAIVAKKIGLSVFRGRSAKKKRLENLKTSTTAR